MSLKAYDGLISRQGLPYIQEQIRERLPRLKMASERQLAKEYANVVVKYADNKANPIDSVKHSLLGEKDAERELESIKTDASLLSVIFQASKILAKSKYVNQYTVHLNITIETIGKRKTLIYPNILVHEHREILLECFEDWYGQDQCDSPDDVSPQQWRQRVKDWYDFNECRGYSNVIHLFSPVLNYGFQCVNETFRGERLPSEILKHIPTNKSRINKIAINKMFNDSMKKLSNKEREESKWSEYTSFMDEMNSKEGKKSLKQYLKDNHIELTVIDNDFLDKKIKIFKKIRDRIQN